LLNCSASVELPLALALAPDETVPEFEPELDAEVEPFEAVCDEPPVLAVDTGGDEAGIREL
jgi:hypothetical protein